MEPKVYNICTNEQINRIMMEPLPAPRRIKGYRDKPFWKPTKGAFGK